jgi:hypothetical protein
MLEKNKDADLDLSQDPDPYKSETFAEKNTNNS